MLSRNFEVHFYPIFVKLAQKSCRFFGRENEKNRQLSCLFPHHFTIIFTDLKLQGPADPGIEKG